MSWIPIDWLGRIVLVLKLASFYILIPIALGTERLERLEQWLLRTLSQPETIFDNLTSQLSDELADDGTDNGKSLFRSCLSWLGYLLATSAAGALLYFLVRISLRFDINIQFIEYLLVLFAIIVCGLFCVYGLVVFAMLSLFVISRLVSVILHHTITNLALRKRLILFGSLSFVLSFALELAGTWMK
jgi:hypothetical protein